MNLDQARVADRQVVQERFASADPITLVAIVRVIILVIEFCSKYRRELNFAGRMILKVTGLDRKIEELEREARSALKDL